MKAVSKIDQLAALAGNELTGDFQRDEEIRRAESQPAPQQPMLGTTQAIDAAAETTTNPEVNYRRLVQDNGDEAPKLGDDITAALLFAGMHATWAGNHWMVRFKDNRVITKRVGGRVVQRSHTGVSATAKLAEWMTEINALSGTKVFGPGGLNDGTTV